MASGGEMRKTEASELPRVTLEDFKPDLQLIRSYPVDLAYRYQSVPIEETEDDFTIMMAEPEDHLARAAIQKACRKQTHVFRGDPEIVDTLIHKYFPKTRDGRMLIACPPDRVSLLEEYAHTFAPVFKTEIVDYYLAENTNCLTEDFFSTANGYDLVFLSAPDSSLIEKIIHGSPERRFLERLATSCLFPQTPRLPIRTIMMLLHEDGSEVALTDLVARISALVKAKVIVLAVLPQVPTMYQGLNRMRYFLPDILQSQTELGCRLRCISRTLHAKSIHYEIHLKQGQLDSAIQEEIAVFEIDLIITARPGKHRLSFKYEDDCVTRTLHWIERPMLLAA